MLRKMFTGLQQLERRVIMKKHFKKYLASLLAVVMLIGMLPGFGLADYICVESTTIEEDVIAVIDEATGESGEEPTGEVAEDIIDDPAEEPTEESTNAAAAEPTVKPAVESTEAPTDQTAEKAADESIEAQAVGDSEDNAVSAPVYKFNGYKTLDDFDMDYVEQYSTAYGSGSYLNPQTLRPSSSYYGYQWICNRSGYSYPFTASFTLDSDYMPQNSVYIAIANYDCDEYGNANSCEYDQVFINGHCVGVLTGNNNTTNTTLLKVDRSYLKAGTNNITIRVGIKIKSGGTALWGDAVGTIYDDDPYSQWWLRVDDIQLLCDGGSAEGRPDVFRVNLTNAELSGNQVNCYVTTHVEDSKKRTFSLEYALYDWSSKESATYGQIIDDDFAIIYDGDYNHEGKLTMPVSSLSGTYTAVVYLKVKEGNSYTILAYDEESFEYEVGVAPAFDVQNFKAVPASYDWTKEPVTIMLSADIDVNAGLSYLIFYITDSIQTPASVDANGHVTGTLAVTQNGFYTVTLRYVKAGKYYKKTTTVEINNIIIPSQNECDHSSGNWEYVFTSNIPAKYIDIGDGKNHAAVYNYVCYCNDCVGIVKSGAMEKDLPREPHAYDANGICICGATIAVTCPHAHVTAQYDNGALKPIFSNITNTHHDVQNGYRMICDDCGQPTGAAGYFDAISEPHNFANGDVCACGYSRNGCTHAYDKFDYVYGSGNWVDCGDGTHKRVNVTIKYTCTICGETVEERIEDNMPPTAHTTVSSEKEIGYAQIYGPDPLSKTMHKVEYRITDTCTAKGCGYSNSTTEYRWEEHDVAKTCVCGYTVTDEELYKSILCSLPEGANPMDNQLIRGIIADRLRASGLDGTQTAYILSAVSNEKVPETYRNIYIYSFFEYDIADTEHKDGSLFRPKTNGLYLGANTNPDSFLDTWFHESGHAVDWNAGKGIYISRDSEYDLYNKLEEDLSNRINETLNGDISALDGSTPSSKLTSEERGIVCNNILGAQNAPDKNTRVPTPSNISSDVAIAFEYTVRKIREELVTHVESSNARMGSDINGGLSNNTVSGLYGHNWPLQIGKYDYWFKKVNKGLFKSEYTPTYNQCSEAWAEYYSAYITNDTDAIEQNRSYFREGCKILDEIAEYMCEYYMSLYK